MATLLDSVVVELDPPIIGDATLTILRDCWQAKRGNRAMPSRKDILPSDLRENLGWVLIVEALDNLSDFRYRLIGTLVSQYFQADYTGKSVKDMFAISGETAIKAVQSTFRKCVRDRVIIYCHGDARWIGPNFEEFGALFLPLSDDGINVNMILHAFVFDKSDVLMARQIASAHGGQLIDRPPVNAREPKIGL